MRIFVSGFVLGLCPVLVLASGWNSISGKNRYGDIVTWQADPVEISGENGVRRLSTTISVEKKDGGYVEYAAQVCQSWEKGGEWFFTCAKDGQSPLAGATYVKKSDVKECGGWFYHLRQGGNKRTPQVMYQEEWEC